MDHSKPTVDIFDVSLIADESIIEKGGKRIIGGEWALIGKSSELDVPKAFSESIKGIDDNPMYATYVMPFGLSRKGTVEKGEEEVYHRYWPREQMMKFDSVIKKEGLIGHKGHGGILEDPSFRDPAVMWVSSVEVENIFDGRNALITKGYIYDDKLTRVQVKTNAIESASVRALIETQTEVMEGQEVQYVKKCRPISFDFVERNMEGIKGTKKLAVSGESTMTLNAEQKKVIAGITAAEFTNLNPIESQKLQASESGNSELLEKHQALIKENIELLTGSEIAAKLSEEFDCQPKDLIGIITGLKSIQAEAAIATLESEIAKLPDVMRKMVKLDLSGFKPKSIKEASESVSKAVEKGKLLAASIGLSIESGNESAGGNKNSGMASDFTLSITPGGTK